MATGSLRRQAQLAAARPDLRFVGLRGNMATRLAKAAEHDAVVVAATALDRLGLADQIAERLPTDVVLPQVAQAALVVECREGDVDAAGAARTIEHGPTRRCVDAERRFLAELGGDCSLPAAAHAILVGDDLSIEASSRADGTTVLRHAGTPMAPTSPATCWTTGGRLLGRCSDARALQPRGRVVSARGRRGLAPRRTLAGAELGSTTRRHGPELPNAAVCTAAAPRAAECSATGSRRSDLASVVGSTGHRGSPSSRPGRGRTAPPGKRRTRAASTVLGRGADPATASRYVRLAFDQMLAVADRLGDDRVNERPIARHTNAVAALIVHCCGVAEFWLGHVGLGRESQRDRDAEFSRTATLAELHAMVAAAREQVDADLAALEAGRVVALRGGPCVPRGGRRVRRLARAARARRSWLPAPRRHLRAGAARAVLVGCGTMTVYLVGAGPGDPGLLTVRRAEVLARADVVVYDRLSVEALLDLAPAEAERISVGKAPGRVTMPQERDQRAARRAGPAGTSTVVRLKGGDPFVFARGGEEAAALARPGCRSRSSRHHLGHRRAGLRRHPRHPAPLVDVVHRGDRPRGPGRGRRGTSTGTPSPASAARSSSSWAWPASRPRSPSG